MANEKKIDQVILGLLSHETLTGYEIKKRIDTTLKYFWSASYGSIYPALNSLEKKGLVSKCETKENGRDKIIYTITYEGRLHLKEWLELPVIKDELRYETMLKLFLGYEVGKDISLMHIQNFEDKIKAELPYLQGAIKKLSRLSEEETHKYYMLTVMFGEKVYKVYLEWCQEARRIIEGVENE